MTPKSQDAVQTYFWMVHYVLQQPKTAAEADAFEPKAVGKPKFVATFHRNAYGRHAVGFRLPRDAESAPEHANFRGAPHCRNLIVGFYATAEEANKSLTEELWTEMRKAGAVYAELQSVTLEVAQSEAIVERKAA